jgi:hypothetical protein
MLLQRVTDSIRYRAGSLAKAILPEFLVTAATIMYAHKVHVGRYPNLLNPKTFNEKVLYRVLFDHSPIWTRLQDKYAVRDYVRERIGEHVLPRWYCVTKNPRDIPFDELPDRFVVKPTHGSGWVRVVFQAHALDREELIDTCHGWLSQNYFYVQREWLYKHIEPRIVVEVNLGDGVRPNAIRYTTHVFPGRARVFPGGGAAPGQARCGFYGRAWNRLSATVSDKRQIDGDLRRPVHLDEMIHYAEILADGIDFLRVDLYDTDDKVYFGELTITPGGGTQRYAPHEFDRCLGRCWNLSMGRAGGLAARAVPGKD